MKTKYCIVAVLCSISLGLGSCSNKGQTENRPPIKVKTSTVQTTTCNGEQSYSGTIEEVTGATLSFPIAGTVEQLHVSTGQRVAKGTLIASVNESSLRSAHDATVAMLEQAQDAYSRMKQLHDNNSLPEIQWVDVQSKLRQAQSSEQIARKALSDGKLYAPFSGVISEKQIERGQNVLPGQPIVKLVNIAQVNVNIPVPENEISKITKGQAVVVSVPALNNRSFVGRIAEKGVAANPLSRSYEVKARIDNPSGELMPGMVCSLSFDNAENTSAAIIVPAETVQIDEDNNKFVWTVKDGKASKKVIEIGTVTATGVIVKSGLADGDNIIIEGQQKVSEGTTVTLER